MATRRTKDAGRASQAETSGQLDEYRRKRDFTKTAEPAGHEGAAAAEELVFVIQKHDASHLHYDLRLELDGVMKSWAVPKGPSLDPAMKRLAMQVEDHPIEYNTFEGTIPKGEYGGGTVMLWDRGTYVPDEVPRGATLQDAVRKGLKAGKLGFTLYGERLTGSFALVRTEAGPKPKWLLIKHRDEAASAGSDITADVVTSVDSGRTMDEIAAGSDRVWRSNRDGRAGGPETRKPPAATADAIAPMLPKPVRALPANGDWTFEPWHDGTRVLAYATAEGAHLLDERGRDLTARYSDVAGELASLAARLKRPFVVDGEVAGDDGDVRLFASDLLLDGGSILLGEPWSDRREALDALFRRRRTRLVKKQEHDDDADRVRRAVERQGLPGLIARRLDAPYEPGTRSDAVLRIALH